ncbi:putative MFS family arabinose efflux permease [Actinocorallia herbida]|uniref:Putative MFS family arabinose efflux permease n=2 Tax=Actinocorallia herbida TaxID=58109 RepID=A0A3N1CTD4_9ACTN|nr:putative MFS family arabinose efflux permease [Actinocorallia herbida]
MSYAVLPLALILLVRDATGSYGAAGLVSGALSATLTVFAPARARLLDRVGARRGLVRLAVPYVLGLGAVVGLALTGSGTGPLVAAAAVAGAFAPPLGPVMRVLWAEILRDEPRLLQTAYALDSVAEEVVFTAGPLGAAALLALAGPVWAMAAVAGLLAVGAAGFVTAKATAPADPPVPGKEKSPVRPLSFPGLRTLVLSFAGVGLAVGVLDVALPYLADRAGSAEAGGVLLALLSAGSALGGLWYGRRAWRSPLTTRFVRLLVVFALAFAPLAFGPGPIAAGAVVFVMGLALAPLFTSAYLLLASFTEKSGVSPTEANTWVSTANNGGVAAGAALSGILLDPYGVTATFALAFAAVAALALVAISRRSTLATVP